MIPKSKLGEYLKGGSLHQIPITPSYMEEGKPETEWHPGQSQGGLTAATRADHIEVPAALVQKLEDCGYRCTLTIESRTVTGPDEIPVYNENGTFTWTYRPLAEGESYTYDVLVDVIPTGYVPPEPEPVPDENQILREKVAAMEEALTATQMALCDMYEANL